MWKGFITQHWGDYMENHYQKNGFESQYTGTVWARRVLTSVMTYGIEAWTRRNTTLHKKNKINNPHREQLITHIKEKYQEYEQTPEILPCLYKYPLQNLI